MGHLAKHGCQLFSSLHKLSDVVRDNSRVKAGFEHGLGLARTVVDTPLGGVHPPFADRTAISQGDGGDENDNEDGCWA